MDFDSARRKHQGSLTGNSTVSSCRSVRPTVIGSQSTSPASHLDFFQHDVQLVKVIEPRLDVNPIDCKKHISRRILGSTPHPEAVFMQQIRADAAGAVPAPHALICDRNRKWSGDARRRFRDADVRLVLIPRRAPNANAYAERFAVDQRRMPGAADSDRGAALPPRRDGGGEHYPAERNHQRLDNRLSSGPPVINLTSRVRRPSAARRTAQFQ